MSYAFPLAFLPLVRCTHDGAPLEPATPTSESFLRDGDVRCTKCASLFHVRDGILDLIGGAELTGEAANEQAKRDETVGSLDPDDRPWDSVDHQMEMLSTMEAVDAHPSVRLLELGCGDGRYTTRLAKICRVIVAVDFSLGSLRVLQRRLGQAPNVGLVMGDVSTLKVTPHAFDRAFSTLTSNLPTEEHREALYSLAAGSLDEHGTFINSMHHHGWRERLRGVAKSGHYRNGIFRHNFTVAESAAAMRRHFAHARIRPMQIYLPLAYRLRLPLVAQSRFAERVPVLNRYGKLVLCKAYRTAPRKLAPYRRKRSWFALAMAFGIGYWALSAD